MTKIETFNPNSLETKIISFLMKYSGRQFSIFHIAASIKNDIKLVRTCDEREIKDCIENYINKVFVFNNSKYILIETYDIDCFDNLEINFMMIEFKYPYLEIKNSNFIKNAPEKVYL